MFEVSNENFRDYTYTELGKDDGSYDYTIRNTSHKYIRFADGSVALYNLIETPFETINLLSIDQLPLSSENQAIKNDLETEIERLRQ